MASMILITKLIRRLRVQGDWKLLPPTTAWGNVMDLDSWRWLDYDIVALVTLVVAITLLELTVLEIVGLTYPLN